MGSQISADEDMNLIEYCQGNGVDMVIKNKADADFDVMEMLLAAGVRVMTVSALWETFTQKIPHSEITQDWLSKLNLRQLDPFVRRIKRLMDILYCHCGIIICPADSFDSLFCHWYGNRFSVVFQTNKIRIFRKALHSL